MESGFEIECVVICAGVVGLASAPALAMAGHEDLVIEKAEDIGTETSSRNSEVIHAGIYYPRDSVKADACVTGRARLYDYLETRSLPYRRCGKLIVATNDAQMGELEGIASHAWQNGVDDLQLIEGDVARRLEPALAATSALISPSTGILDSHAYMVSLLGDAEDHGAVVAYKTEVNSGEILSDGRCRLVCSGAEDSVITTRYLVNSGGLSAPGIAARLEGYPADHLPQAFLAKGNYFSLVGSSPFSRLIYPVPEPGGLGVHLTLDMGGQARFGPDVEWIESVDYVVDPHRSDKFHDAIRSYWPGLPDNSLVPGYAGIRPKISGPGQPNADFRILGPDQHGLDGQVHLFGIESPGLTASLAIAERVASLIG
ncbi:MAG: NAD(P)/FAD-dependent oxidoreductase [Hyphomonas sp.]|nr:NAD(P)/FAD-dependent oxidoreductase [Hyphomonas sp.]